MGVADLNHFRPFFSLARCISLLNISARVGKSGSALRSLSSLDASASEIRISKRKDFVGVSSM